jgi:endoglucanase
MNWGTTASLGTISLATLPNGLSAEQVTALRGHVTEAADYLLTVIGREGYRVSLGKDNFVWGSNADVLNNGLILALAYDFTQDARYLGGVTEAMDYLLGRNALGYSFISGYGARAMQHPHHRFWGNQGSYPPPPPGAVAGGPNGTPSDPDALNAGLADAAPAKRYIDILGSYSTNEVAINWNAPLVWVAAYLDEHYPG